MSGAVAIAPLADAGAAARLHMQMDEPWNEGDWARFLVDPRIIGLGASVDGAFVGVVLVRSVADEAEILTILVDAAMRRRGVADRLLSAGLAEAAGRGAAAVFLEVAADNTAALGLYRRNGFVEIGRRRGYYRRPAGAASGAVDALTMRRPLRLDAGAHPT